MIASFFGFLFAVLAMLFVMFLLLFVIPTWKIFSKAGQAGWKSIIPIYNTYILVEIAKLPWWVFLGFFIPVLNLVVLIVVMYHVSMRFGHGMGYGLGLSFLPFVFLPTLGYGRSQYEQGPANEPASGADRPQESPDPSQETMQSNANPSTETQLADETTQKGAAE